MIQPSYRQQAVLDAWDAGKNILCNAVAGAGKSSVLMMILERCEYRTLFLAFNKTIQEELQNKIDAKGFKHGKALTMHSLGFSAIREAGKICTVVSGKNFKLVKDFQKDFPNYFKGISWKEKISRSGMLMEMNDVSRMFLTNKKEEIFEHMEVMDKYINDYKGLETQWSDFIKYRDKSYEGNKIEIDFLDMLYLPVIKNYTLPISPYYLLMDEVQDFSYLQHKLIDKLLSQGTVKQWVSVGDDKQSIYGFSGALPGSFYKFLEKDNVVELPLDICYRCAPNIIDEANQVYAVMQSHKTVQGIVDVEHSIENIEDNSMIICRNTKPLVNVYFKLLNNERKVFLNGDDFLKSLLTFSRPYQYDSVTTLEREVTKKISELSYKSNKTEREEKERFILEENLSNFNMFHTNLCSHTNAVKDVQEKIQEVIDMKGEENCISLCTIHKSKGLEANTVYILDEYLIPSKFAKSDEQLTQERNLKYVARTRAKEKLVYLNLKINEQ